MRNIIIKGVALAAIIAATSCSSDGFSEYERVKASFLLHYELNFRLIAR